MPDEIKRANDFAKTTAFRRKRIWRGHGCINIGRWQIVWRGRSSRAWGNIGPWPTASCPPDRSPSKWYVYVLRYGCGPFEIRRFANV